MKTMIKAGLFAAVSLMLATQASAAVVAGGVVNGLTTFVDTNDSRVWARLDNFFNTSMDDMATAVTAAGFTVADRSQVEGLLNTLPLPDAATWDGYRAIMGGAPNRDLIWGGYGPPISGSYGWAYAYRGDGAWSFVDTTFAGNQVANGGTDSADENIWAYQAGRGNGAVPEPTTWALSIMGLGMAGAALRRRRVLAAA